MRQGFKEFPSRPHGVRLDQLGQSIHVRSIGVDTTFLQGSDDVLVIDNQINLNLHVYSP